MRNLIEVLDQILTVIPESEESFRAALLSKQDSCGYTAPEAMGMRWQEVAAILSGNIPKPIEDWEVNIVSIWTTLPEEDVRKLYG